MPGTHIGGSFHGTPHTTEAGSQQQHHVSGFDAVRPGSSQVAGSVQTGAASGVSSPVRQAGQGPVAPTGDPVLRLRGGGNLHPSGGKHGDREPLVPEEAGSSSQRMYHGTRSDAEAQRAANEAKRNDVQSRLDQAKRELDDGRRKYADMVAELAAISVAVKRLDHEVRQSNLDPARRDEIGRQQHAANDDFWRKTREVAECREAIRKSDDKCRGLERKLDRLRWT